MKSASKAVARSHMPKGWTKALSSAKESSDVIYVEAYCRRIACPAREVSIKVKDYDDSLLNDFNLKWVCPVCAGGLALHHAMPMQDENARRDMDARASVNRQMFERDHEGGFVPAYVFFDERLPDTPPGYWNKK